MTAIPYGDTKAALGRTLPQRETVGGIVVTDPFDPARILAITQGGTFDISHDRGATWGGIIVGPGYNYQIATDIPGSHGQTKNSCPRAKCF